MKTSLADLVPDEAEVDAIRRARGFQKGKTRLQETMAERPLTKIDEKQFKTAVWTRDKSHCRCCGRKVQKLMGRVPERGEVNHLHGRSGDLRFEVRAAALMCLVCHEEFTGKVGGRKRIVVAQKTFTTRQGTFADATYPLQFPLV